MEETWYEFEGDDSCEDCRGWDGKERRCDCGNRRVGWECLCGKDCQDPENCGCGYAEAW